MSITLYIFGSVIVVSLVSLVGVLSISFRKEALNKTLAFLVPMAVGALLGDALFHLIPEVLEESANPPLMSFMVIAGIVAFFLLERILRWHHHHTHEDNHALNEEQQAGSKQHLGKLLLISDALHNLIDGVIIAASYLISVEVGIATTIAVVLHEIPQEIGDFGVLIYSGYSKAKALLYNFVSALAAVAGALIVVLSGSLPDSIMQSTLAFAAGIFIYIAASDLVPELQKNTKLKSIIPQISGMGLGVLAMYLIIFLE
ncbi:MAG: ZIP family metal transporter [bacterium]|nr:ZIP family metal transporter [bacterium]